MIKTLKLGLGGNDLYIISITYRKKPQLTSHAMVKKSFLSGMRNNQGCPVLPLLFNLILEILASAIR